MRRVLLIADLEGIRGVDAVEALALGSPAYPAAAERMTDEVAFVAGRLLAQGFESIVISDSHRSGAPTNLDAARLPAGCEVRVEADDLYGGPLLDDVAAVACIGMHAGGDSSGFGAHTVSLNTAWTLGARSLTETHLVQLLAAERGVPLWFASGDDVLAAQLGSVPFVRTKLAVSRGEARSLPADEVAAGFEAVLRRFPPPLVTVPREALRVRFQRAAEADAAESVGHGVRVTPTVLEFPPQATFAAQYEQVLASLKASDEALAARVRGFPGTPTFARSVAGLLLEPWV